MDRGQNIFFGLVKVNKSVCGDHFKSFHIAQTKEAVNINGEKVEHASEEEESEEVESEEEEGPQMSQGPVSVVQETSEPISQVGTSDTWDF